MDEQAPVLAPQVRATLALRSAGLGTYVFDAATRRSSWDDQLHALFGLQPGEVTDTRAQFARMLHPDDAEAFWAAFERSLATGEPLDHEYRIRRADGEERWVHSYGSIVEADGRRLAVGVLQDVTDRRLAELASTQARRAEEEARSAASASQRRLRLLAQVSSLVDTPLDLDATLRQVADLAIGELADWCTVELERGDGGRRPVAVAHRDPAMVALARDVEARYPPDDNDPGRQQILRDLKPVLLNEISDDLLVAAAQDAEHLAILRDLGMSSAVAVPLQAAGHAFGVMTLIATHGRQLTEDDVELAVEFGRRAGSAVEKVRLHEERERARTELALSEARYRTLVESGSLAVWRANSKGAVVTDMVGWREVTGSQSTLDWAWLADVHPDDQERTRSSWLASVASGEPYLATYRVRNVAGGWKWVDSRGAAVRADPDDPTSPIVEWIGSVTDVTTRVTSRTRTEALRDCAEALAQALDVEQVLASLEQVAAHALTASGAVVALVEEDRTLRVHQRGYPTLQTAWVEPLTSTHTTWPIMREVLKAGEPRFVSSADELLALLDLSEAARVQAQAAIDSGEVSWAYLPLRYGDELLGVVRFGWHERQPFDEADQATLVAIAAQHSAALTRARLYDAERTTSLTLQAALAPEVPRHVDGVSIGLHYRPAGVGAQVGGDWADAIRLSDGRVCLVVGDVMGSGVTAAATMGRLRTSLATLAMHLDDPGEMLHDLDRMLFDAPGDQLATVALAVVDQHARAVDLYSAGHLPALIVPWLGDVRIVAADQVPPVGVGWGAAGVRPQPTRVALPLGSVIALCSDGLVETRTDHIDTRLAKWAAVVQAELPLGNLDEEAPVLVDAMQADEDDDVTLLLARLG